MSSIIPSSVPSRISHSGALSLYSRLCAIVKSVRWYFLFRFAQTIIAKQSSTYSPLFSTGAPSNVTVAACSLYANISELIKRSCTPTLLCLKVHFYASITHTIIHDSTEKNILFLYKFSNIFIYKIFVVSLCPILK